MFEVAEASLGVGLSNTRQAAACFLSPAAGQSQCKTASPCRDPCGPTRSLAATFSGAFKLDDGHTDASATLGNFWFLLAGFCSL